MALFLRPALPPTNFEQSTPDVHAFPDILGTITRTLDECNLYQPTFTVQFTTLGDSKCGMGGSIMVGDKLTWFTQPTGGTEQDISSIEKMIGRAFPPDYREFVRKYAGGEPEQTDFELNEDDGTLFHGVIGVFLSLKQGAESNLLDAMRTTGNWLPIDLVPVIEDPGGNYVCLDYRKSTIPCVSYWRHDRKGFPNEISFVSNTFNDFLRMLHDPDDEE